MGKERERIPLGKESGKESESDEIAERERILVPYSHLFCVANGKKGKECARKDPVRIRKDPVRIQ